MDMVATASNVFSADPLIRLMIDVIEREENRKVLQTDLRPMLHLLLDVTTLFPDQRKEIQEARKIWMQLLHNSFTEARSLLHRPQPGRPRRCLDRLICNPRTLSQEINEWKVLLDCLFQELQREIVHIKEAMEYINSVIELMRNVINVEEKREVLQTDLMPMLHLLLDLTTVFPDQRKEAQEALKFRMRPLHNCLTEARSLLHRPQPGRPRRCLDRLICNPRTLSQEINEWKVLFDCLFQELQSDLSIFVTDPIPALRAEESEQPLSEDEAASEVSEQPGEAWMLFQRIAFKDGPVPTDNIQLCARNIVDACKGSRSAISVVAAAMIGKTSLLDWQTSLDSMKIADPSFRPENHPRIDPQLYQLLRWSYDALPTSDLKNCFLSSAIYEKDVKINVRELVQMWIAEGLVRSKQETHLMDMAIARTYVNLLLDRRFFHNATYQKYHYYSGLESSDYQCIRVDGAIREMAMYIAENEQNCFLKARQRMQHFPTIHDNEDCKRISLHWNKIEDLPSEFRCPKLVSLILSENRISVVPSGFLVGLTSLKVLDLSENEIRSIPSSVGQLQQLQLLRLEGLDYLRHLPEEIGHLSSLQFLSLRWCRSLESLPSQIGQLQNLKYLNISFCDSLRVIPHEISQLTALTTLDAWHSVSSSISRLKGLVNLTMLKIWASGIEEGIMGTWLDMRHLWLTFDYSRDDVMDDLPDDMQNMRKLQSLRMERYRGLSLPEYSCKFQHLQHLELIECWHLKELSPLERLPNLKRLELDDCRELKELGIGNYGKATGFLMLEVLVLWKLQKLESMAGASNSGVWNERTLPKLRILHMRKCPNLKRLPVGMDKLLSLKIVEGENDWWQQIIWEDEHMKKHIASLFKAW